MPSTWKTVRVFISSTFRDMHAERDHLIKVVFPALRESLLKDRIYLDDIDLRWGVTREQAENNQVLDLCLRQIDDCRPFFIGILGERYGWVPLQFPADACKSFGWIQNHPGKSVTELEILHGVLNDPAMTALAFFYLRDPAFIKDVPPERKQVYLECPTEQELRELSTEAAEACAGERRRKQHELKEKLRALRPGQFVYDGYPCHWDRDKPDPQTKQAGRIAGLEEFGESVRVNLERGISTDPKLKDHFTALAAAPPDPFGLAEEQDYHDRFMESRLRVYVGRDKINDELFAFANSNETVPCLMTGPSGSGKSAALARFVRDFQHKHSTTLVIAHFIGASPRSTNLRDMLRRFCQVLKVHFRFAEDVPEETAKLSVTFREFVGKVPADARVILVIDALNQLDETERAQELYWLPTSLLPQVKVIVSCISDSGKTVPVLDAFGRRKHCPVQLAALSDAEQREIIRQVPSLSAKTLDDGQVRLLMSNPATANPLFLLVALEELRGFAPFERLNERIAAFPREGDTVTTIFTQVIERLAVDFDEKLVETVLTLLASARRGLSERELQELVAGLDGADDLFPVLRQLRPYLLMRGGLVDFYHRNLFKAVNECYHSSETQRLKAHRALADYFESQPLHWRRAFELPWQLQKVRERDRLRRCLLDIDLFRMMAQLDEMELIRYWVWLQEERSMGGLYRDAFEKWLAQQPKPRDFSAEGFVATTLGNFLNQSGLPRDAEPVLRRALAFSVWRLPARQTEVATTLNNLARLLVELEQFDEAEDYYCWALEMYESSYGHKSSAVATCVSNLGQLYDEQGRNEDAEICLRLALALDNDLFDANGPVAARDMVNLAMLLKDTFRVSEAEPLLRRAVTIYEQQLGPNHPDVALTMSNLARLLQEDDRGAEAEPLLRRALVMNEHAFGSEHPRVGSALNNLADLLMHKNRHEDAEPYLRRALAIDEACFGPDHPRVALALNNLANCLRRAEQLPEAESMLRRALAMRDQQTAGEHQYENLIVNSLGGVLQAQGRNTEAEAMYRRALKADEAFYGPNHPKVAIRLSNLAFLRAGLGHRREADTLIQRAQDIIEKVYGSEHAKVAEFLRGLIGYYNLNDSPVPVALYQRLLAIDEKTRSANDPIIANDLIALGEAIQKAGAPAKAEPLFRRALGQLQTLYGAEDKRLTSAMNHLGLLLWSRKQLGEASDLLKRALRIEERQSSADPVGLGTTLNNLSLVLHDQGDMTAAEQSARQALTFLEQAHGADHPNCSAALNNLSLVLYSTDRYIEAEPYCRRNLELQLRSKRTPGAWSPNLRSGIDNYAVLLRQLGRAPSAVDLHLARLFESCSSTRSAKSEPLKKGPKAYLERGLWRQLFKLVHLDADKVIACPSRILIATTMLFDSVCFPDSLGAVTRDVAKGSTTFRAENRVPYEIPAKRLLTYCPLDMVPFAKVIDTLEHLGIMTAYREGDAYNPAVSMGGGPAMTVLKDGSFARKVDIWNEGGFTGEDYLQLLQRQIEIDGDLIDNSAGDMERYVPEEFEKRRGFIDGCLRAAQRVGEAPILKSSTTLMPILCHLFPRLNPWFELTHRLVSSMGQVYLTLEDLAQLRTDVQARAIRADLWDMRNSEVDVPAIERRLLSVLNNYRRRNAAALAASAATVSMEEDPWPYSQVSQLPGYQQWRHKVPHTEEHLHMLIFWANTPQGKQCIGYSRDLFEPY